MINKDILKKLSNLAVYASLQLKNPKYDSDMAFTELFNEKNYKYLFKILNTNFPKGAKTYDERELKSMLVEIINSAYHNDDFRRTRAIGNLLTQFSSKELAKFITEQSLDLSKYYCYTPLLDDIDFIVEILENGNLGKEHDNVLISSQKDFFYNDSPELRKLIFNHPAIYDKLVKLNNKPNFPIEFLKELVYIFGSQYFVSHLNNSLKDDAQFMQHIIIENPMNIFRGHTSDYKSQLRKNAFFIFGDNDNSILKNYGMEYIMNNCDCQFLDFSEYLKFSFNNPDFISKYKNKMLSDEEIQLLEIRGKISGINSEITNDLARLLEYNFKFLGCDYNQYLIDDMVSKYQPLMVNWRNPEIIMSFVNNIAVAYQKNLINEFDELCSVNSGLGEINIDMNILTKEYIEKIGIGNLKKISYYSNSLFILSQVIKEGSLDTFSELLNNKPKSNLAPAIDVNVLLYSVYMYKDAIKDLMENGGLTEINVKKIINITKNNKLLVIKDGNDIIKYEQNLKNFCDENIQNCTDVSYAKELLCERLLKTSRENVQDLIIKYKDGLKLKQSVNYELLEILEIVDGLMDIDAIKVAYDSLKKYPLFSNKSFEKIEQSIKKEIVGDNYIKSRKIVESNKKATDFYNACKAWNIKGIIPDVNSDFQALIHVLGAYGSTPSGESIKESWNTAQRDNVSGICTTLITNDCMQAAVGDEKGEVILGFLDGLSSDNILMCAPYDIFSINTMLVPNSKARQNYIDSKNMANYCRGGRHSKYSEVVITRYHGEEKRQPDFILFFDYQFEKGDWYASCEAAKEFGVPIVFIDTKEFFNKKWNEFKSMLQNFVDNPNIELAKELMVKFETIKYGFEGIPGIDTSMIGKDFDDWVDDICYYLNDSDKVIFYNFIEEENKKKEVKDYIKDREETINNGKKEISLKLFNEMRKKYGMVEATRIMMTLKSLDNMNNVSECDFNINPKGDAHGK